jgi:gliding motility-associated lipoprotein GldD
MKYLISIILIAIVLVSCEDEQFTPKPHGYFRVSFPKQTYSKFEKNYPFSFDYSSQSLVYEFNKDSAWVNIYYPYYKATIYITYKNVNEDIQPLMEQSRKYAYKHAVKADAINEKLWLNKDKKVYGITYDIKGNAASPINFYLTDSSKHFLSGALYFANKPNKDSLAPMVSYIREDIVKLIESLEWKP